MQPHQIRVLQMAASRQHGLVTATQAAELGTSRDALRWAVERGWVRYVRRGVYAFAGCSPSRWEDILAASLMAGPDAVISHGAAAAIHRFWGVTAAGPELTMPGAVRRGMAGVRIHRSWTLAPEDVVERCGVQVSSPIRTLIDIAPTTSDLVLPRLIDEGSIARIWTAERIAERLAAPGPSRRRGVTRLRRLLSARLEEGFADSPLEQRVFRVLKPRVPPFEPHYPVNLDGRVVELDMAWPKYLIAAEIEGRRIRTISLTKFESGRLRSNLLARHGWREIHLTAAMDDQTLLAQVLPVFPAGVIAAGAPPRPLRAPTPHLAAGGDID